MIKDGLLPYPFNTEVEACWLTAPEDSEDQPDSRFLRIAPLRKPVISQRSAGGSGTLPSKFPSPIS